MESILVSHLVHWLKVNNFPEVIVKVISAKHITGFGCCPKLHLYCIILSVYSYLLWLSWLMLPFLCMKQLCSSKVFSVFRFHVVASKGNLDCLNTILIHGVDITATDAAGRLPQMSKCNLQKFSAWFLFWSRIKLNYRIDLPPFCSFL